MELKEARLLLKEFTDNAIMHEHPFVLVHFSKEDDRYEVTTAGMDKFDTILVIVELLHRYKIKLRGADLKYLRDSLRNMELEDLSNQN